jgi:signal transduction histidine kinase
MSAGRRRTLGLRAWLVLAAGYLLGAVLVAIEVPYALSIQRRAVQELTTVEVGYASLLASQVAAPVSTWTAGKAPPGAPEPVVAAAAGRILDRLPDARVLVMDRRRQVLLDTDEATPPGTLIDTAQRPELTSALAGNITTTQRFSTTLGRDLLLVAVPVFDGQRVVGAVRISQSLGDVRASVRDAWLGLAGVGLAALAVGLVLAWVLAGALARPVARLERVARRLGAGELEARAEPEGSAEVVTLAGEFNRMADAVTANLRAQQDFLANASHQLRTPLTGLRLRLEAIQAEGGPGAEQAAKAQGELERLTGLVQDLLTLARVSSVQSTGGPVRLDQAAGQAAERWAQAAGQAGQALRQHTGRAATVWADPADVGQVLDNLVENALRYCPPGTTVTIGADARDGYGLLSVGDDGPGIPAGERERVFDRFFRGSVGRRAGPGTGLGLAIVTLLAGRWGGRVALAPGDGGRGTRVEVTFPASPASGTSGGPPTIA